jgi:hypothetical protein
MFPSSQLLAAFFRCFSFELSCRHKRQDQLELYIVLENELVSKGYLFNPLWKTNIVYYSYHKGVITLRDDLIKLSERIEELRSQLNSLFQNRQLVDQEVISASEKLDAVINEYHKLMKYKSNK